MTSLAPLPPGSKVSDRWEVMSMLGEGGFGAVYEVKDLHDANKLRYALKVEAASAPPRERVMRMDVYVLKQIRAKNVDNGASRHFCQLEAIGMTPEFRFIVMTMVGKSLSQLRRRCGGRFNARTVAHVAIESLLAIMQLHSINILHRDIKPSNLTIGQPPNYRQLYLIDFGLCRLYRHPDGRNRRPRDVAGFRGTLTYASLASHKNQDLCRRDDLWSYLYMLVELSLGKLPWHNAMRETMDAPFKTQVEAVGVIKSNMNSKPTEFMCGCAVEFLTVHKLVASLGFYDDPKYDEMLTALRLMESRRRRVDKDGEPLEWEPKGAYHERIKW